MPSLLTVSVPLCCFIGGIYVVDGPISAVLRVLSIIKDLEPPLGLHINFSKCELFSVSRFPDEMKKYNCLISIYLGLQ